MIHSKSQHLVPELLEDDSPADLLPKRPYLAAVRYIADRMGGVEAMFDQWGRVRTLTAVSDDGLFEKTLRAGEKPALFAEKFLSSDDIVKALGLRNCELEKGPIVQLPGLGTRVEFRQAVKVDGKVYPVRGGFVHVFVDGAGHIFQVNSTVRFGRKPQSLGSLISSAEAVTAAKANLGFTSVSSQRAEFVFATKSEKLFPAYEVTLSTDDPRRVATVLVKATTGQVIAVTNKLHAAQKKFTRIRLDANKTSADAGGGSDTNGGGKTASARVFLEIPDPKVPIDKQVHDAVLSALPDPTVLKNEHCIIYLGNKKKEVRAKADGTFNYAPKDPEFAGVITFHAFQEQMALMKSWGLIPPDRPMPIFVHDPAVRDNAYFDPENYEIHLGIGSGAPYGLAKAIAYDLGVTWHENGHFLVFLQAPGKDLPGSEGGGIHESIGDVLGDMLMDFWFRLKYAKQLGKPLTPKDVDADPRIIGKYAMPPDGIRIQKNTKRTPRDKTGEPHDDGLISGGAKADLLVAMATKEGADLAKAFEDFGRMTLAALALVPSAQVTFQDLLRAYLTADKKLFNEANKALIVKAFGDHGITLKTAENGSSLVLTRF